MYWYALLASKSGASKLLFFTMNNIGHASLVKPRYLRGIICDHTMIIPHSNINSLVGEVQHLCRYMPLCSWFVSNTQHTCSVSAIIPVLCVSCVSYFCFRIATIPAAGDQDSSSCIGINTFIFFFSTKSAWHLSGKTLPTFSGKKILLTFFRKHK